MWIGNYSSQCTDSLILIIVLEEKKKKKKKKKTCLGDHEDGTVKASEGETKTPLFLATISGCVQIVKEILNL